MITEYSLKKQGELKRVENFKIKEFACKDGSDKILIDDDLIIILQKIRDYIKQPIEIISGYRTENYNKSCGGANNSYHLKGMAADIKVKDFNLYELAILAAAFGARGVGIYNKQQFIHIDTRPSVYLFKGE